MKKIHTYKTPLTEGLPIVPHDVFALVSGLEKQLAFAKSALRRIHRGPACESFKIAGEALNQLRKAAKHAGI